MLGSLAAALPTLRCLQVKCALAVQPAALEALAGFKHLNTLGWTAETIEGELVRTG
jgi:hypothetical protein